MRNRASISVPAGSAAWPSALATRPEHLCVILPPGHGDKFERDLQPKAALVGVTEDAEQITADVDRRAARVYQLSCQFQRGPAKRPQGRQGTPIAIPAVVVEGDRRKCARIRNALPQFLCSTDDPHHTRKSPLQGSVTPLTAATRVRPGRDREDGRSEVRPASGMRGGTQ